MDEETQAKYNAAVLDKYVNALATAQQQNFSLHAQLELKNEEAEALKQRIAELENKDEEFPSDS